MLRLWVRSELVAAVVLVAGMAARPAAAQRSTVARADRLLAAGRVFAAETLYYWAARRSPRDPEARLALGRYLAARGAWRVGAVLMEEARFFGGDPKSVALHLAPVYERLGDYRALASLPGSSLPYADRARADWLREHPPAIDGPDSVEVPYYTRRGSTIGAIVVRIGGDSLLATLDLRSTGLVLDTSWSRHPGIKRFSTQLEKDPRNAAGVTLDVGIGDLLTLRHVPTRFAVHKGARDAVIGLDLLGALAPTFDPARGRVVLRKRGRVADSVPGERIPTLSYGSSVWLIHELTTVPLDASNARTMLGDRRWTLLPRRGEIVVE